MFYKEDTESQIDDVVSPFSNNVSIKNQSMHSGYRNYENINEGMRTDNSEYDDNILEQDIDNESI